MIKFNFFQTVKPLKSEKAKKILSDEKLRPKLLNALKDLREGKPAVFLSGEDKDLKERFYKSVLDPEDKEQGADEIQLLSVSETKSEEKQ